MAQLRQSYIVPQYLPECTEAPSTKGEVVSKVERAFVGTLLLVVLWLCSARLRQLLAQYPLVPLRLWVLSFLVWFLPSSQEVVLLAFEAPESEGLHDVLAVRKRQDR